MAFALQGYLGAGLYQFYTSEESDEGAFLEAVATMAKCTDCWIRASKVPSMPDALRLWCANLEAPYMLAFTFNTYYSLKVPVFDDLMGVDEELAVGAIDAWVHEIK